MKLLRFSVENYRSFNSKQELAINFDDHCANAIIGPNGCGKSNLFTALKSFIDTIHYSTKFNGQNSFEPFVLKKGNDQLPTSFSIEIEDNDTIYAYSFWLPCSSGLCCGYSVENQNGKLELSKIVKPYRLRFFLLLLKQYL